MSDEEQIVRVKLLKTLKIKPRKYLPVGMYKQPIPDKIMELVDAGSRDVIVYRAIPEETIDVSSILDDESDSTVEGESEVENDEKTPGEADSEASEGDEHPSPSDEGEEEVEEKPAKKQKPKRTRKK